MPRPSRTQGSGSRRGTGRHLALAGVTCAAALAVSTVGGPPVVASTVTDHVGTAALAPDSAAKAAAAPVLKPNMRSVQPSELRIQMMNGVRWLRFTSQLANTGKGPVEVRPNDAVNCGKGKRHATQILYRDVNRSGKFERDHDTRIARRSVGCMVFHPSHHHWHFEAAARYTLWNPRTDTPVVSRPKTSFCLRDILRVPDAWHVTKRYPQFYGACDRDTPQGISIGWSDRYGYYLPGQAVPLPRRLRDGVYCLRVTSDPQNELHETDNTDNRSAKSFRLKGRTVSAGPPRPCRLPEQTG